MGQGGGRVQWGWGRGLHCRSLALSARGPPARSQPSRTLWNPPPPGSLLAGHCSEQRRQPATERRTHPPAERCSQRPDAPDLPGNFVLRPAAGPPARVAETPGTRRDGARPRGWRFLVSSGCRSDGQFGSLKKKEKESSAQIAIFFKANHCSEYQTWCLQ